MIGCAAWSAWWLFLLIPAGLFVAFLAVPLLVEAALTAAREWRDLWTR